MQDRKAKSLRRRLAGLWLLGICLGALPPASAEPLPWALLPLPGVVELKDGVPATGLQLDALRLLEGRLPDMQPSYRAANYRRLQQDMAQGMDFCAAPFFRRADTDRIGYFVPYTVGTPIQLVIRRAELQRFPLRNGRVALGELLRDESLRGGLATARTYPEEIRGLLHSGLEQRSLEWVGGAVGGENLPLMVSVGRLDYSFEFGTIISSLEGDPRLQKPLLSVPLAESMALAESGIYCTRSPWGLRVAGRLDQAIRDLARQPEALLELYRRTLPPQTYQAYGQKIADYYHLRADWPTILPAPATPEVER